MNKGRLIVFEGISGSGKETQAMLLKDALATKGITAHIVYHPTPEVKLLLTQWRRERHVDHITEVYLLLADRYDRVRQIIKPALDRGEWVISLRNDVSAVVYQGKTKDDRQWIKKEFSRFEPPPDFLFYFDLDPAWAHQRIGKRRNMTGEAEGAFEALPQLQEKHKAYQDVLLHVPHHTIHAQGSMEEVHAQIMRLFA